MSIENWIGQNRKMLLIAGPTFLGLIFTVLYLNSGRYLSTDDAYIKSNVVQVSSNLSGRLVQVLVKDNQIVKAGDILFKLDEQPFLLEIAVAKAQLAAAELKVNSLKASYLQCKAEEESAQNNLEYQKLEFDRQQSLSASKLISKTEFDQAKNAFDQARSHLKAMTAQTENILSALEGQADLPLDKHPEVMQMQALLNRANLNLSYTCITASIDGIVTKVEQLQVGNYINEGIPIFALLSNKNMWIEANFKENELTYIRPGQSATFTIDSYPNKVFTGKVESISPGTGSTFSLLPPENASGNWVKVVQRLAVHIKIDQSSVDVPLQAGLSVNATVDNGYHHALFLRSKE